MKHIMGGNSRSAITNTDKKDIQPNALDLKLDKVFKISNSIFEITDDYKAHRVTEEVNPDSDGFFNLSVGDYEVVMENYITIGPDEAGWVITRSTLNRNGVYITSGLYDSGYSGVMAGCMHVTCGPARIKKGTRVGQFLLFDAEMLHLYDGDYGVGKAHDKKYG